MAVEALTSWPASLADPLKGGGTRTLPLLVRRRGEATESLTGGDGEGFLLSTMVVMRVNVVYSWYFNPKIQTDSSFLRQVNFNPG